jgi:hypothetical protein
MRDAGWLRRAASDSETRLDAVELSPSGYKSSVSNLPIDGAAHFDRSIDSHEQVPLHVKASTQTRRVEVARGRGSASLRGSSSCGGLVCDLLNASSNSLRDIGRDCDERHRPRMVHIPQIVWRMLQGARATPGIGEVAARWLHEHE